jgi:hypothetical protein
MTGHAGPQDGDAWEGMVQLLASWGLSAPPVPVRLRPALRGRGRACWSTRREDNGSEMYMWTLAEAAGVLSGDTRDYLAVSHAGHGVNSYAVTYHLVYRGLALFVQEAWGGAYMDNDAQAASVADMFDRCRILVDLWEARLDSAAPARRLLCLESRLRGTSACGWTSADLLREADGVRQDAPPAIMADDGRVPAGQPGFDSPVQRFLRHYAVGADRALAHAESLLTESFA